MESLFHIVFNNRVPERSSIAVTTLKDIAKLHKGQLQPLFSLILVRNFRTYLVAELSSGDVTVPGFTR